MKRLNRQRFAPLLYVVATERDAVLQGLATGVAELLDASNRVCFKLEQEQILLLSARNAWIGEATAELDEAVRFFAQAEWTFRGILHGAAQVLGAPPEATLREVALVAEEPWSYIFSEGANELRELLESIERNKATLREQLTRSYLAASAALEVLGVSTPTAYDSTGTFTGAAASSVFLNTRV